MLLLCFLDSHQHLWRECKIGDKKHKIQEDLILTNFLDKHKLQEYSTLTKSKLHLSMKFREKEDNSLTTPMSD